MIGFDIFGVVVLFGLCGLSKLKQRFMSNADYFDMFGVVKT